MIIGHRGASYDAPENTIAAIQEAWAQKADGVEADFHLTSDNEIVCIHDEDTFRTTGTRLSVHANSLAELRKLDYGAWKHPNFSGEAIPTLADVLAATPAEKRLFIELKAGPSMIPLIHKILNRADLRRNRLMIISFDKATIAASKQRMPYIKAHWLTSYLQNPDSKFWQPTATQIAQTVRQCNADGLGTKADRSIVTPDFIAELRSKGVHEFHVWTVDAAEDAQFFHSLDATAITTNRPRFIRHALE
jgi:glycerophosphoryl diester phosphodiesterase